MTTPTLATVNAELAAALSELLAVQVCPLGQAKAGRWAQATDKARIALGNARAFVDPPDAAAPPDRQAIDFRAGDASPAELAAAAHNFSLLRGGWCTCATAGREAYYANPRTSAHGWLCSACRKITQTG